MEFSIRSLENGWLFGQLLTPEKRIPFAQSYLLGEGAPEAFLRALTALLAGHTSQEWICWNGESCVQVWHLTAQDGGLVLDSYCAESGKVWPTSGDGLRDKVRLAEPTVTAAGDLFAFAQSACEAFRAYAAEETARQWQANFGHAFPRNAYRALRRQLRK